MPHKHTRRKADASTHELPPTEIARPLPVTSISKKNGLQPKYTTNPAKSERKRKRRNAVQDDDTPRAFKRLMMMASGKPRTSGLDDGAKLILSKAEQSKQETKGAETSTNLDGKKPSVPTIKPGESMVEYSARVDAALPLAGLVSKHVKDGKDPLGLKISRTKKERKMHKLYDEWRQQTRKFKERQEEERELAEARQWEEEESLGVKWMVDEEARNAQGKKKKKKGKRGTYVGEVADQDDDPWDELRRTRGEVKVGLNDVAQAPPKLNHISKKYHAVDGAVVDIDGVPKAAGSLCRREELRSMREDIVASYRKLVKQKRASSAMNNSLNQ